MRAFYETTSERRWWLGITGRAWLLTVLILVTIGAVTATLTAIAPWSGRAKAYRQQQSGDNRIAQNSQFFNLKAQYDADVLKIPVLKQAAQAGGTVEKTNLTGITFHCLDMVQQYAALSGSYISKDFKDAGLPAVLDAEACR